MSTYRANIVRLRIVVMGIGLTIFSTSATGQFTLGGQLLQRAEFRSGYGKLIEKNQDPVFSIGQRARVQIQYEHEKVNFFVSAQDIRTWGSSSQAKETDNLFSIHEAYAEIPFGKNWKAKLGRQELNYDNVRFLGNLDWALQARAHDFALVKYEKEGLKLHIGGGYNQAKESLTRQPYTIANQYKAAQMLRVENQWSDFHLSFLFWNNGMVQLTYDTLGNIMDETIRYSQTLGFPTIRQKLGSFTLSGFGYVQTGRNNSNKKIRAHNASIQVSHLKVFNEEKGRKLQSTLGLEIISGTAQQATDNISRSYNPFYGTNHAHNGYMDYFYVGNRHADNVGLQDYFLRLRYDNCKKLFLSLNAHWFSAAAAVYNGTEKLNASLGNEFDFTAGYLLNEVVSLQVGYSQFFATQTLEWLQSSTNPATIQQWGYLALLVRPNMKNRFVGLLF